jgi:hypothetical protein
MIGITFGEAGEIFSCNKAVKSLRNVGLTQVLAGALSA